MTENFVPTLLIGLGGIGSEVVEKVYGMIPEERRERIKVHAFDTNVNDISSRTHIGNFVTQISTDWTVGMYLRIGGQAIQRWFPHEQPLLLGKSMTDGAGQVRSVCRLAYRDAVGKNKLANLDTQINNLCRVTGDSKETGTRVVIVCSLAGGTGAGSFLQTALYLREKLRNYGTVMVRGIFLLPDILINSKTIKTTEYENIMANTYASLKELDAITRRACASAHAADQMPIELEYRPLRPGDAKAAQDFVIAREHLPYDACFLYDWENTRGENLGTFANYKEQMARTVFLQLFSPLSSPAISAEDNLILSLIGEDGLNRYCGSGTAMLRYPYDDLVEYCALKWAQESLAKEWRKLDMDFEEELRAFHKDAKAGVRAEKPQLEKRYVALLFNYAHQENPVPFFRTLYRSTVITNQMDQEMGTKAEEFIGAVDRLIENTLANDEDLRDAENACRMDEGKLQKRDKVKEQIEKMEMALEVLKGKVSKAFNEHKTQIVRQVIGEDCDAPDGVEGDDDFRLNTWLLRRPEPLHPVAARFVLYQISAKLGKLITELAAKNKTQEDYIKRYDTIFDLPETEDLKDTVGDRIRIALNQGRAGRLIRNALKEFVEEYVQLSGEQLARLRNHQLSKLKQAVYEEVQESIRSLQGVWEAYFRELGDVQYSLLQEINLRAKEHEGLSDLTLVPVLATMSHKEKLWEDLRISLQAGDDLPPDIRKRIVVGRFSRFCSVHYPAIYGTSGKREDVEQAFRNEVVDWYRKTLQEVGRLNLDVMSALQREATLAGVDPDQHIRKKISDLDQRAWPLVPEKPSGVPASSNYWGIHPDCLKRISQQQQQELLADTATVIENPAFSPYEIIRYRANYGLLASDFPKFSAGDPNPHAPQRAGTYFVSYQNRIRELLTTGKTVTPHLDKRWHLRAYLPDLNAPIEIEQGKAINRAFLLGLIYERLCINTVDRRKVWEYYGPEGRRLLTVDGKPVPGKFSEAYRALAFNPLIAGEIIEFAGSELEKNRDSLGDKRLLTHSFCKGAESCPSARGNIFDAIFEIPNEATGRDYQATAETLLKQCLLEITGYFRLVLGPHRENKAKEKAAEFIKALHDKARLIKKSPSVWNRLIEDFLAELV